MYFYCARYYHPHRGRFVGEDPIEYIGGSNLYPYVENNPIGRRDPLGLDWLNNVADLSAGMGSTLSGGLTDMVNDWNGNSSVLNPCSGWRTAGTVAGIALTTAIGGAAGAEAATANAGRAGYEYSHWIPARMGGPRSVFNGNYVSQRYHYLTDPYRYPPGSANWGDKLNPAMQQLLRIPWVYDGAAAGTAAGGASAMNGRSCGC